jgi:hypothetical protein
MVVLSLKFMLWFATIFMLWFATIFNIANHIIYFMTEEEEFESQRSLASQTASQSSLQSLQLSLEACAELNALYTSREGALRTFTDMVKVFMESNAIQSISDLRKYKHQICYKVLINHGFTEEQKRCLLLDMGSRNSQVRLAHSARDMTVRKLAMHTLSKKFCKLESLVFDEVSEQDLTSAIQCAILDNLLPEEDQQCEKKMFELMKGYFPNRVNKVLFYFCLLFIIQASN